MHFSNPAWFYPRNLRRKVEWACEHAQNALQGLDFTHGINKVKFSSAKPLLVFCQQMTSCGCLLLNIAQPVSTVYFASCYLSTRLGTMYDALRIPDWSRFLWSEREMRQTILKVNFDKQSFIDKHPTAKNPGKPQSVGSLSGKFLRPRKSLIKQKISRHYCKLIACNENFAQHPNNV